jgi:spoIIIJ-associated protein
MTSDKEYEGKNVDAAVAAASESLGVLPEALSYEVVSYGATGIFGLVGNKKARIRVSAPANLETAPVEKTVPDPMDTESIKEELLSEFDKSFQPQAPPRSRRTVPLAEITPEIIEQTKDVLGTIVGVISDDASIVDEQRNGRLVLNVVGGNSGVLIGRRGQTLEAIQYLVEKVINKGREDRVLVQVDVEGYLETRRTNLEELAARMADKAKRRGRPTTIGQMNAHDRRIIHLSLKDDPNVRTQSVGEGHLRKLVIFPKQYQHRKRRGGKNPKQQARQDNANNRNN